MDIGAAVLEVGKKYKILFWDLLVGWLHQLHKSLAVAGHIQETGLNVLDTQRGVQQTATNLAAAENMTTEESLK